MQPRKRTVEAPGTARQGWRSLIAPILVCAALVILAVLLLPVRYEANDDFAIVRQLNPLNGFGIDPHVYFLSWTLARAWQAAYRLSPWIPWYGLTLYFGLVLGGGLLAGVAWRSAPRRAALFWVPALALFLGTSAVLLSFTSVSLILLFGALMVLFEGLWLDRSAKGLGRLQVGLAFGAIVLAYLLRWKLAVAFLGLGLPLLLFAGRRHIRGALLFALGLLAVLLADRTGDRLTGDAAWRDFERYNLLRSSFHDTADGAFHPGVTEGALQQVGWERADYEAYRNWILYDDELFNAEKLRAFLAANRLGEADLVKTIAGRMHESLVKHWGFLALAGLALGALIARGWPRWRMLPAPVRWRVLATMGAITAAVAFFLGYRFMPRIFLPLLAYWVVLGCLMTGPAPAEWASPEAPARASPGPARPRGRPGAAAVAALFAATALWMAATQGAHVMSTLQASAQAKSRVQAALRAVRDRVRDPDLVLLMMDPNRGLRLECIHPLREFADLERMKIFLGGTGINSPRYRTILRDLGLESGRDFLRWMLDNPRVLLVLDGQGERHTRFYEIVWLSYVQRHVSTDREVGLVPVFDFRDGARHGLAFYRLLTGEEAGGAEGPGR